MFALANLIVYNVHINIYSEVPNRRADRNKRAGLEEIATLLAYVLSKSIKVTQWKNGSIKRPRNTANVNFPSTKLESLAFGLVFVRETTQILTAKQ